MSATKGSAFSLRSRSRLIVCSLAIAFALSALFASVASARPVPTTETYMALGDSLAFGYSQNQFNANIEKYLKAESPEPEPAANFKGGYAEDFWTILKRQPTLPVSSGIALVNSGCPGETTDSMIGNGPLAAAMEYYLGAHGEAPCAYHNVHHFPLKNEYAYPGNPGASQLENALYMIATHAGAGIPVTTITLNIGANDELRQIAECETEVGEKVIKGEIENTEIAKKTALGLCIAGHVNAMFTHILTNIGASLYVLRKGHEFGGIDYTGNIVVLGGYDPYGSVFFWAPDGSGELLSDSTALSGQLNSHEATTVAAFGACYADPQPKFNPNNKLEPNLLKKWTNMANFTTSPILNYGYTPLYYNETGPFGKADGPDIHPTLPGYQELANIMWQQCA